MVTVIYEGLESRVLRFELPPHGLSTILFIPDLSHSLPSDDSCAADIGRSIKGTAK